MPSTEGTGTSRGTLRCDSRRAGRVAAVILVAVAASLVCSSCFHATAPESPGPFWIVTDYEVPVDSLRVTSPIALGDTLRAWLWGVVGPAPCYEFTSIFAWHESDWRVYLTAVGVQRFGGPCSDTVSYLDWEEYAYVPTVTGRIEIIVGSPGDYDLVATVDVVEVSSQAVRARSN
jgi:hypothetical protein